MQFPWAFQRHLLQSIGCCWSNNLEIEEWSRRPYICWFQNHSGYGMSEELADMKNNGSGQPKNKASGIGLKDFQGYKGYLCGFEWEHLPPTPYRLLSLNSWSPDSGTVWPCWRGVSLEVDFEFSKGRARQVSLCVWVSQLLIQNHACLPVPACVCSLARW